MHQSMMSYADRYNARQQRMGDISVLGMDYVMERDKILKQRCMDPLLHAQEYERTRLRVKVERNKLSSEVSINGPKVKNILKTKTASEVIGKFIEAYSEDDYPPMFQEFACKDEENIEMQKLSALFEKECQLLAVDFLNRHADKISEKALIGFVNEKVCESTFNRMFDSLN